jgi:hypothetical protein
MPSRNPGVTLDELEVADAGLSRLEAVFRKHQQRNDDARREWRSARPPVAKLAGEQQQDGADDRQRDQVVRIGKLIGA